MAMTRLELSQRLHQICENCYYSPPSTSLKYPCILYELTGIERKFADNIGYLKVHVYQLTVIDEDPDSELVDKVLELEHCSGPRPYKADNLNHFVFTLYW